MRLILLAFLLLLQFLSFCQTKISISLVDYTGDTLYIGNEADSKHNIIEKVVRKSKDDKFVFYAGKELKETVLFAQKPGEKKAYQFLYDALDGDFELFIETKDKLKMRFLNHKKNTDFYSKLDEVVKLSYRNADSLTNHNQIEAILTNMQGDTLIHALDNMLLEIKDKTNAMYYYISQLLNLYPTQHIGFDKAFIHLVEKYVKSGKYKFSQEEISNKSSQADDYKILLNNKTIPDFTVFKENKESLSLYSLNANITILIFWSPTCTHCKKAMPHVATFMDKYKSDNLKILSICDKGAEKVATCWPFIQENKMNNLINAADENRSYNTKLKMRKVPKIFILDKNKKIILKDFNILEIEKYYNYCKTKLG
jgi:thiol-disulfide isomerase/thioredoxin